MSLLEVEGLSVCYGGAVLAADGVSIDVGEGASVGLLGANGAGKTSLLRAISGLLRFHGGSISGGSVRMAGRTVTGAHPSTMVELGLGQALEGRRIFSELTVAENLRVGAFAPHARRDMKGRRRAVLEWFPRLADRLDQRGGLLSGGEQQMLAIGRALMSRPRLLLLDEPSLGLAPLVVAQIGDVLRDVCLQEGIALLLVDQSTALAVKVTDHAYLIESGQIRSSGTTTKLLADGSVRAAYLGTDAGSRQLAAELGA
ncbi:MAG TPA: ABC transporter ATP-binding protein [Solirubrobacteraceae bacterium]|nr:ABC transporter ATP-binding protein [Solirubrobacteraceae bacterium]